MDYEKTRSNSAPFEAYVSRVADGKIVFKTKDMREQDAEFDRLNAGGAERQYPCQGTRIARRQPDGTIWFERVKEPIRHWF
jgi:hypothetical protein